MATVTRERELLRELVTLVRGECPSLLNEDSGGDVRLSMAIDDALAAPPAEDMNDAAEHFRAGWVQGKAYAEREAQAPPASDPPGLVEVVKRLQDAENEWDGSRAAGIRLAEARGAVLAYPLPASPQAETTRGDE